MARLLRLVEERAYIRKIEEGKRKQHETDLVPYLHDDCVSNILVRLPLDSIQRSRFVCKPWYNIIDNAKFIAAHLRRAESVLIFVSSPRTETTMVPILSEKPNVVSVEARLNQSNSAFFLEQPLVNAASKFSVQFIEFKDGKSQIREYNISCLGKIRATCNGLILLDNKMKKGGLILMNPVTRKMMPLPLGTLFPQHNESYGFSLSSVTGDYKVVHLFRDQLGYINCEILVIGKRSWREVDGPSFGLIRWFGYNPVFAIGALHWIPQIDHNDYVVSLELEEDKFHQITLPKTCRTYDRIVEVSGFLGFVTHDEVNQIDVWILKGLFGDVWIKQHSITIGCILDMVPLFSLRIKGEMVFKRDEDGSFYVYNFQLQEMTKVEAVNGCVPFSASYLPHVNSLVSWCSTNGTQDM
ncbi:F-box/kelch-repeat protein At3g23880-like [Humulus lupulus]|uniref:F-box/kelch-repeat protein At3g23880-like n=1 Tax=Humulus lupulus TaxID=3486 RepID=UPI002B40F1F3|nr:F-box/kelch-repeat protein At3g23880-like [Humulus lupulus]XP_062097480.1 F-box/kelch-repeat protein At3g23880-like [Humulus lupulus]